MFVLQVLSQIKTKLKEIRLSKNIISYLICVLIASILWLMNALNKEYTAEISYPVKYINFPQGKYPVSNLPNQLQLEVKAKGFSLLGHRIRTSFLPVTFNMSTYVHLLEQKDHIWEFRLNTNDIKDRIGGQLSSEIKLLNVYPEEILFRFAIAKTRKIAIRPVVDYTLRRQYILSSITAKPDSIAVSGPALIIDTLQYVSTLPIHLKDIGKNQVETVKLAPLPQCTFEEQNITVDIRVEQFTEARKSIPITPRHVPDSMNIRLFPPHVEISYEVGLSKYDKVSEKDFTFTVDYPQTVNATYLDIKVKKSPSFIKNLTFTPQKAEYILEKK